MKSPVLTLGEVAADRREADGGGQTVVAIKA